MTMRAPSWVQRHIFATVVLAAIGVAALFMLSKTFSCRAEGLLGPRKLGPEEQLVSAAEQALAVITTEENRKSRRPVGFDDVLRPIDDLIAHAMDAAGREDYDAVVRLTGHAARLAETGLEMALRSPGNPRTQRFPEQIADAMQLSAGMRLASLRSAMAASDNLPPEGSLQAIRHDVARGLRNRPDNPQLLFLSAAADQLAGQWPAAAQALEMALTADPRFADAWNELGLVRIQMREFDKAGAALEKAMEVSRPAGDAPPSAAWKTAAFNLADFHYNLALHYRDELLRPADAGDPARAAARADLDRHRLAARKAFADARLAASPEELPKLNQALSDLERLGSIE